MSDYRAIGGVSTTLSTLLQDRMEIPGGAAGVAVTIGTPKLEKDADPTKEEEARVNLFLYRVTENGFVQNQEIPGHGSAGAFGYPPLSLNLHYLLTGYGSKEIVRTTTNLLNEELGQEVLGSAMRVLHDVPVVTDRLVTVRSPAGKAILDQSLRGSFEALKLSLEPLSLEDITKIWTALGLRYRLSAAYVVTTVQIESRRPRTFPRPVGEPIPPYPPPPGAPPGPGPHIDVVVLRVPTITDLRVRRATETLERTFPYARIKDTIVLRGTGLTGGVSTIEIGALVAPATMVGDHLELELPDDVLLSGEVIPPDDRLQPGVQTVRVLVNDPAVSGTAFGSNYVVFMLVPTMSAATYAPGSRTITIDGARLIRGASGGETVIGHAVVPQARYATGTPAQLVVPVPDTLPSNAVPMLVSGALPASINMGTSPYRIDVTIGATTRVVTVDLPATVARDAVATAIQSGIRGSAPERPEFARARAGLIGDRLVLIAGGAALPVVVTANTASTAATILQLDTGVTATNGYLSGALIPFPTVSAANPSISIQLGALAPQTISFVRPTYIDDAATKLEAAIIAIGGAPEYTGTRVIALDGQLLIVPGALATAAFASAGGDSTSVIELRLVGRFGVRVRVNGAESFDERSVILP